MQGVPYVYISENNKVNVDRWELDGLWILVNCLMSVGQWRQRLGYSQRAWVHALPRDFPVV